MRCVARGDDFAFTGRRRDLLEVKSRLEEVYELKMRAMSGDDSNDYKEITSLNRSTKWDKHILSMRRMRNMLKNYSHLLIWG